MFDRHSAAKHLAARGCLVLLFAVGLSWAFWWPLWCGGGLIGGDLYPYYFPQKAYLADSLKQSEIPLWNPLVGYGYPTLGESQTGVLYPAYLVLYSLLDINSAYNLSQLLHYVLALVATYGLARRLNLEFWPSLLAAVIFVYGWFPARICLEWSIVGGAWCAAFLWAETVYLQTGRKWALAAMSLCLGLSMLAGHYNLAFITLLLGVIWPFLLPASSVEDSKSASVYPRKLLVIVVAMLMGFGLAAVQLVPSWELKTMSQRQGENEAFTATYGHLPPLAISQLWMPWSWHGGERAADELLAQASWLSVPDTTNQVEAFVYFGLLSLFMAIGGLFVASTSLLNGFRIRWVVLGLAGLVLATGWPTYWLVDVPGIGFFRGPGRYSLITALVVALLAADGFQSLMKWRNRPASVEAVLSLAILSLVTVDLWAASRQYNFGSGPFWGRQVFYATLLDDPPIAHREESLLKEFFERFDDNVRLYAPGQNIPTLLGVSALPVYLGLGPAIYETEAVRADLTATDPEKIAQERQRLVEMGVTHILSEQPLNADLWKLEPLFQPLDALLNRAFGRREPFYLYHLAEAPGRCFVEEAPLAMVSLHVTSNEATAEVRGGGQGTLVLKDLDAPGWECLTHEELDDEQFRAVQLYGNTAEEVETVRWQYRPWSVRIGGIVSLLSLIVVVAFPIWIGRRVPH